MKASCQPQRMPVLPSRNDSDVPTVNELVYQAATRARRVPSMPSVSARSPGMYTPASAMPVIARQPSAGSRPSLNATPRLDSALSALDARKIVRAGMRSVRLTSGRTPSM